MHSGHSSLTGICEYVRSLYRTCKKRISYNIMFMQCNIIMPMATCASRMYATPRARETTSKPQPDSRGPTSTLLHERGETSQEAATLTATLTWACRHARGERSMLAPAGDGAPPLYNLDDPETFTAEECMDQPQTVGLASAQPRLSAPPCEGSQSGPASAWACPWSRPPRLRSPTRASADSSSSWRRRRP